jgi:Domain of unknown function (DU1801)
LWVRRVSDPIRPGTSETVIPAGSGAEDSPGNEGHVMKNHRVPPKNIDEYIASFSPEVQSILEKVRSTIRKAAPEAIEKISYQMPTFALMGNLIDFAAFKKHIGIYRPVKGDEKLKAEILPYQGHTGTVPSGRSLSASPIGVDGRPHHRDRPRYPHESPEAREPSASLAPAFENRVRVNRDKCGLVARGVGCGIT